MRTPIDGETHLKFTGKRLHHGRYAKCGTPNGSYFFGLLHVVGHGLLGLKTKQSAPRPLTEGASEIIDVGHAPEVVNHNAVRTLRR
jgi:hypothetical protein